MKKKKEKLLLSKQQHDFFGQTIVAWQNHQEIYNLPIPSSIIARTKSLASCVLLECYGVMTPIQAADTLFEFEFSKILG